MGEGKISTEAFASILANSGKLIFAETGPAKARRAIFAISRKSNRLVRIGKCGSISTVASHIARAAYDGLHADCLYRCPAKLSTVRTLVPVSRYLRQTLPAFVRQPFCANRIVTTPVPTGSDDAQNPRQCSLLRRFLK